MHIEPGYLAQAKIAFANIAASGLLLHYARDVFKNPANLIRIAIAALFFSLFMQSFSAAIGPSELHFVGAMVIYLTLGFIPTLFGFAVGLLLQGVLFDPMDLPHLAVNSLSLIIPLISVHYTLGRALRSGTVLTIQQLVKMDALYYAGVTTMVGFWIMFGEVATPFAAWLAFASSYVAIVVLEPVVTYALVKVLSKHGSNRFVNTCFAVKSLRVS